MKSFNEMAARVMERRDKYVAEKRKQRKKLTAIISCFCLCAVIGIGAWQGGLLAKQPAQTADDAIIPGIKDWYGPGEENPHGNSSTGKEEISGSTVIEPMGDYPAMIMVDGTLYYLDAERVCEVDDSAIIGYTSSYTDREPEQHGETNFNRVLGMPFAKVEGGIAVLYQHEWHLCVERQ